MSIDAAAQASFHAWCKDELFGPEVREGTRIINAYCDLQLAKVYRTLDLQSQLQRPAKAEAVADALGYVPSAAITLRHALRRLAERTSVVTMSGDPLDPVFQHQEQPADPTDALAALRAQMAALGEDYTAATDFLDFGAEHFVESLKDDPDFMDKMLSGRTASFEELWFRATNVDPLQDLHGAMGARAIDALLDRGTILEIGGGTGNGVRHLLRHLKAEGRLDKVEQYVFTDISMRFVLNTKHEIQPEYPEVKFGWKFFDLNKPFEDQKIAPESVDLIYAVNAAHVAKDLVGFLKGCRSTLRPGGHVVFAERIRIRPYEMAPREFTLNLSEYHRSAAETADYRPMHTYLAPDHWRAGLERAGFATHALMPDLDALADSFPDQYAAVVVGKKD